MLRTFVVVFIAVSLPSHTESLKKRLITATSASPSAVSFGGVPGTIFFTGPWLPDKVVENNRRFVPKGTEFRFYDDEQLHQSAKEISGKLESVGVTGVFSAMQQLRPWAFRADLWRYMILWENGGIYLDAKLLFADNISKLIPEPNNGALIACRDEGEPGAYFNGVLAARPKEPVLLHMIQRIVTNVKSHYYGLFGDGHADLYITGPGALGFTIAEDSFSPTTKCRFQHHADKPHEVIEESGLTVLIEGERVHDGMHGCSTCNFYGALFKEHAVYCDEAASKSSAGDRDPCDQGSTHHAALGGGKNYRSIIA